MELSDMAASRQAVREEAYISYLAAADYRRYDCCPLRT